MLRSRVNYSVVCKKSDFLRNLVIRYIVRLNIDAGLCDERSLLGDCVLVSDVEEPGVGKYVVSGVERVGFTLLDLDVDVLSILYMVVGIGTRECMDYLRDNLYRKHVRYEYLYFYAVLLSDCEVDGRFNVTKADLVVAGCSYRSVHSVVDKYRSIVNYVVDGGERSLFDLVRVFGDEVDPRKRLNNIAYFIKNILDEDVPGFVRDNVSFDFDIGGVRSLLNLSVEICLFENWELFVSNLVSKLRI